MNHREMPQLGSLIPHHENRRDAVHVAIAPVTAAESLAPGDHVGFLGQQVGKTSDELIGIVDPFLPRPVASGERFWLVLYPNTITDMRHVWSHPAFRPKVKYG